MPTAKIKKEKINKEIKKEKLGLYFEAVGRRKTSVARVRLFNKDKNKGNFNINEKDLFTYFPRTELQEVVKSPFKKIEMLKDFYTSIKVNGGGIASQAGAIKLGISRALLKFNPDLRLALKQEGFLKRDPRMKERRKFGLKKARKAAQWSKR